MKENNTIAKKVACVTGGMGDIGTAICQYLFDCGFKVVVGCNINSQRTIKTEWLENQRSKGFDFIPLECDVSDWDSTVVEFNRLKQKIGGIDVLVNNAGVTNDATFRKMTKDQWHKVIDVELNSVFNVTKQVVESMVERRWGRIINISSVAGQIGSFGQTNHSAAKAGLYGFTMALARELGSKGITVNTVSLGIIESRVVHTTVPVDKLKEYLENIPLKRAGLPEEVASIVGWFASEQSSYATGTNFSLNGGIHMYP